MTLSSTLRVLLGSLRVYLDHRAHSAGSVYLLTAFLCKSLRLYISTQEPTHAHDIILGLNN